MINNNVKGISLIMLIITIIIIIILAGSIILSLSNNNPISQAEKAKFIIDVGNFQTELNMYITKQVSDNLGNYSPTLLQANETSLIYDGTVDGIKTIEDIIPSIGTNTEYNGQFTVVNGNLVFVGTDIKEQEWASEILGEEPVIEEPIIEEPFIANKPILSTGMTAKKWDGSSWVTVSDPDTDTSWYNYENKEWANVQTADGSMWVWIPRYEYRIITPHVDTAQTIDVNFLSNLSTTETSGYTLHPAFTFGVVELEGIWVAKFEASGTTNAVNIKPGVSSLRNITINDMFTACRNMEINSNYGWGTSGAGIDTHLMKNIEWGAVAYLSQSIYGKNSEVWINPNESYVTGQVGTSVDNVATSSTYLYDNVTYGVNASTTGNIYGIYDMSGGASEYVAAYIDNGTGNLTTYGSLLVNAGSQYKDVYVQGASDTKTLNYEANSDKKGDAVYETSIKVFILGVDGSDRGSWYGDYSYMIGGTSPFFRRGGNSYNTSGAGMFCFYNAPGSIHSGYGFRPVMVSSSEL